MKSFLIRSPLICYKTAGKNDYFVIGYLLIIIVVRQCSPE